MMKKFAKILSVILAMVMLCSIMPCVTFAANIIDSGTCGDNLTWTLDDEGTLTISGEGEMKNWSRYSYAPWYSSHSSIETVVIENGATSIGNLAFSDCNGLTSVDIPNSITKIGCNAFKNCDSLTSISIPDSVTSIDSDAFFSCNSLTSIHIGSGVTTIGVSAFYDTAYYNDESNWEDGVLYIGNYLNGAKRDISGEYVIKDGTKFIPCYAFYDCDSLTSISMPDSVTTIDDHAFWGCNNLASVTIGNGVNSIGYSAFYDCCSLADVYYKGSEAEWNKIVIDYTNDCLKNAKIHYNSGGSEPENPNNPDNPDNPDESLPAVERSITASFAGGQDIIYNVDDDKYNMDSFMLVATLDNLFINGDWNREDCSAKNVAIEITLPEGYSFGADADTKTNRFTFDKIETSDSVSFIVYVKNPPVGKGKMTAKITGDNVTSSSREYEFEVGEYKFELNKYRADYLLASELGRIMESDYVESSTPCRELIKAADEAGLDWGTKAWSSVMNTLNTVDKPSSIADYAFEEKDIYEAIIMSIFESSVNIKVVEYVNNAITKQTTSLFNTMISEMKNVYNYDMLNDSNFDYTKMSDEQVKMLEKSVSKYFEDEHANAVTLSDMLKYFGYAVKGASNLQALVKNIIQYYNISQLSGAMAEIMRDMYQKCPEENIALRQALIECENMIQEGTADFAVDMAAYSFAAVGTDVAQFGIDKLWGSIKNTFNVTHPSAFLLQASYTGSKYVTQVLFNADGIEEQYCKIDALVKVENILREVYTAEKSEYKREQTEYAAEVYNSVVDVMFNMLDTDCKYASAFADSLDKSLAGKIEKAMGDTTTEDFKKSVSVIQSSCDQFHEEVLTFWIYELEKEGSSKYEEYKYLIDESNERLRKKYEIACPVDVYVFDKDGVLAGSVINNVPYCREGANITIGVYGDKKTIYFDSDEYDIVYKGNDSGSMDIEITEYDEGNSVRNTYFNGVALEKDLTYSSKESGETLAMVYALSGENEEIAPDYDSHTDSESAVYTAEAERGYFAGLASAIQLHAGEKAEITAYVPEGYEFTGWTSDAGDIFADAGSISTAICMPNSDVKITANVRKLSPLQGEIEIIACDNGIISLSISVKNENSSAVGFTGIAAVYNSAGEVVCVKREAVTAEAGENLIELEISGDFESGNYFIKYFMWNNFYGAKPISEEITTEIEI